MLELWTIYDHPLDFPDQFVARCFLGDQPTDRYLTADTLEELRRLLPPGLICFTRDPYDDPAIVETWF